MYQWFRMGWEEKHKKKKKKKKEKKGKYSKRKFYIKEKSEAYVEVWKPKE
jgi:hypothetical protein